MITFYIIKNLFWLNKESHINGVGYGLILYACDFILIKQHFVSLTMLLKIVIIN